jgi:hypothetical protein
VNSYVPEAGRATKVSEIEEILMRRAIESRGRAANEKHCSEARERPHGRRGITSHSAVLARSTALDT